MIVLGLESATGVVGVAVCDEEGVRASATARTIRRQVETLHPMIERVLADAGTALSQLDAIVVDVGPGRFTAMRVGISGALALSVSLGVPIVALCSTEILRAALADAGKVVVPVLDVRRGQVAFELGDSGPLLGEVEVLIEALDARYRGGSVLLVGEGALEYASQLQSGVQSCAISFAGSRYAHPDPAVLAELGLARLLEGKVADPYDLQPEYLRAADVRINWVTRDSVSADMPSASAPAEVHT